MKLNLNQITIMVANLQRSIDFYTRLGLQQIVHNPPTYARFVCPDGNTTFSLHTVGTPTPPSTTWIYFETPTLDEDVAALQQQDFIFQQLPADQPWLWREARLQDPDGTTIILYHAGENRLNPPWRLP
jgi:catechol 2,3-dioxygenase-like lactoylglutathione lyase family enzyme